MTHTDTTALRWFKSSYSDSGGGQCVEVAVCPCSGERSVHLRDSKDTGLAGFAVAGWVWEGFVRGTVAGQA
ncbi:DUF397 domain-containing protein [Streptomyces sp. NPDC102360]|uniref:DUF397 domain-containing protein n=1 Tax=Streptomyces sp. NPDC102360 TaxID=3366160 RepID=UPI003802E582